MATLPLNVRGAEKNLQNTRLIAGWLSCEKKNMKLNPKVALGLLVVLAGCVSQPVTEQRSIQLKVSRCLSAGNSDYWRYLSTELVAPGLPLKPDELLAHLRKASEFASGQLGSQAALEAQQTFQQVFFYYRDHYNGQDANGNRVALRVISDGIHDALASRL